MEKSSQLSYPCAGGVKFQSTTADARADVQDETTGNLIGLVPARERAVFPTAPVSESGHHPLVSQNVCFQSPFASRTTVFVADLESLATEGFASGLGLKDEREPLRTFGVGCPEEGSCQHENVSSHTYVSPYGDRGPGSNQVSGVFPAQFLHVSPTWNSRVATGGRALMHGTCKLSRMEETLSYSLKRHVLQNQSLLRNGPVTQRAV